MNYKIEYSEKHTYKLSDIGFGQMFSLDEPTFENETYYIRVVSVPYGNGIYALHVNTNEIHNFKDPEQQVHLVGYKLTIVIEE